jgi:apolipoprotein N-acyltransferase
MLCALLTLLACCALRLMLEIPRRLGYLMSWGAGVFIHLIAFYWLYDTIARIGGFGPLLGTALFLLFAAVSALQFPLVLLVFRHLPHSTELYGLRTAIAWCSVEFLLPRIFPWVLGHGVIALSSLVQIAESLGAGAISFLLLWLSESIILLTREKTYVIRRILAPLTVTFCLLIGVVKLSNLSAELQNRINLNFRVRVVQANISLEDKHNSALATANILRHQELSDAAPGTLVIWPETAVHSWVSKELSTFSSESPLHPPTASAGLLLGALTTNQNRDAFNSALGISDKGHVVGVYDKRVLMPYGEYTPFAHTFPILREMNRGILDFQRGQTARTIPFDIPLEKPLKGYQTVRIAPLICYEDVITGPATIAVRDEGASLLVNMTNDAWFGPSAAPFQHHLIARFRAIETRRFLIRASNTGLSAIVHPSGATLSSLPIFEVGVLDEIVTPLESKTLFVRHGNALWWIFELFTLSLLIYAWLKR